MTDIPEFSTIRPAETCHLIDPGTRYAEGVVAILRSAFGNLYPSQDARNQNIRVMPDDRPVPNAGQLFIGVNSRTEEVQNEEVRRISCYVSAYITLRTSHIPTDRVGSHIWKDTGIDPTEPTTAIQAISASVITAVSGRQEIKSWDGSRPRDTPQPPLLTPLFLSKSPDKPRIVGAEHFGADPYTGGNNESGLVQLVELSGGLIMAPIPSISQGYT